MAEGAVSCRWLVPVPNPLLKDKCSHPRRARDFYPTCDPTFCPLTGERGEKRG